MAAKTTCYAIAESRSHEGRWKGYAVCRMTIFGATTHTMGSLRGIVNGYQGWVEPIDALEEEDLRQYQQIKKKDTFDDLEVAKKELFKRKLRGAA